VSGILDIDLNVSRETLDDLQAFAELLARWNARINLVAASTIPEIWQRHIIDSAQLIVHAPEEAENWVDLGSGGGLPGLVCAILARELRPSCQFSFVESDKRKAAFLMTASRELKLSTTTHSVRAESLAPQNADIVSARALAPLADLLPLVARHLAEDGTALLPKGKAHAEELAAARREWQFDVTSHVSRTDPLARLLILKEIRRA